MKILIGVLTTLVLATAAGFYINHRMKVSDFNEKMSVIVAKDQGMTELVLKMPGAKMTYKEIIDLFDKSVTDRTEAIIDLRGLYPNMKSPLKDSLIEFLSRENDFVRDAKEVVQKYDVVSRAFELIGELLKTDNPGKYIQELRNGISGMAKDANLGRIVTASFRGKYGDLVNKEKELAALMTKEGLRFAPIFEKYEDKNMAFANNQIGYFNEMIEKAKSTGNYTEEPSE